MYVCMYVYMYMYVCIYVCGPMHLCTTFVGLLKVIYGHCINWSCYLASNHICASEQRHSVTAPYFQLATGRQAGGQSAAGRTGPTFSAGCIISYMIICAAKAGFWPRLKSVPEDQRPPCRHVWQHEHRGAVELYCILCYIFSRAGADWNPAEFTALNLRIFRTER